MVKVLNNYKIPFILIISGVLHGLKRAWKYEMYMYIRGNKVEVSAYLLEKNHIKLSLRFSIFFRLFTLASIWFLLFSLKMPPDFEQKFKNPCFYDACHQTNNGTKRKLRCLPFFHVLGVDKCGSTDLYYRIVRHPQISPNNGVLHKETSWWSWRRYGKQLLTQIASPSISNN